MLTNIIKIIKIVDQLISDIILGKKFCIYKNNCEYKNYL